MDFIERWFGVSPDGGNGLFEVLFVASVVAGGLAFAYARRALEFARRLCVPRMDAGSKP